MQLTYIVLATEDVSLLRDWYQHHLELTPDWDTQAFVRLSGDDGAALGIHRGTPLSNPELVQLHFEVQDIDATYDQLKQSLTFQGPPKQTNWGSRVITTHDPVGHTIELYTPTDT